MRERVIFIMEHYFFVLMRIEKLCVELGNFVVNWRGTNFKLISGDSYKTGEPFISASKVVVAFDIMPLVFF